VCDIKVEPTRRAEPRPYWLSRDRKGADYGSQLSRDKDRHGFTLPLDDVPDRLPHIVILP